MIPPIAGAIGPLGPAEWSISPGSAVVGSPGVAGAGAQSFGGALSSAIDSLEQTQSAATQASQQLATGQLSDPTQAVTAVENASLSMDLASQLRTKLTDATNQIFQTQI